MGYMHIDNLYKSQEILEFRKCYALEKINGSSAHIKFKDGHITFFSGGESHERFKTIFNEEYLINKFSELVKDVVVYGEVYGGKCQGMSSTYGKDLKFVVFDICIDEKFLSVKQADEFTKQVCLEFVDYNVIDATVEAINYERDKPSTQAKRNGIVEDKIREGVVLRPLFEVILNNGKRVISKHKRAEFNERVSEPEVDKNKRVVLEEAELVANEWVTIMRLNHVLDKTTGERDMKLVPIVIKNMVEDVLREAEGEIKDSREVRKAIGARAAKLYKEQVTRI